MPAFIHDFVERRDQIEIGAEWVVRITYYSDANFTAPMDWAGWSAPVGQIRANKSTESTLLLDFSDANCSAEFDDADLVLTIGDTASAAIDWQNGYIQVESEDLSGANKRILEGRVKTNARVYNA
jgi:hypothetical protein